MEETPRKGLKKFQEHIEAKSTQKKLEEEKQTEIEVKQEEGQ